MFATGLGLDDEERDGWEEIGDAESLLICDVLFRNVLVEVVIASFCKEPVRKRIGIHSSLIYFNLPKFI